MDQKGFKDNNSGHDHKTMKWMVHYGAFFDVEALGNSFLWNFLIFFFLIHNRPLGQEIYIHTL